VRISYDDGADFTETLPHFNAYILSGGGLDGTGTIEVIVS